MIKIRLSRGGARNNPFYRIVAVEEGKKRDGAPLEIIGYWHPVSKVKTIDKKRLEFWINKGALLSQSAEELVKMA